MRFLTSLTQPCTDNYFPALQMKTWAKVNLLMRSSRRIVKAIVTVKKMRMKEVMMKRSKK